MRTRLCFAAIPLPVALAFLLPASQGRGADVIKITKQGAARSGIDLSSLVADPDGPGREFKTVLQSDLARSGWFSLVGRSAAAYVVAGRCRASGSRIEVECDVVSAASGATILGRKSAGGVGSLRAMAHALADEIVFAAKGIPGIASSRIVMVGNLTGSKELFVCDSDGGNLLQITSDGSISIAPAWNPDGNQLAYTSFKADFPYIYTIDLDNRAFKRRRLTRFPGLNACAAYSPDGKKMALALSKDGSPDIFVMDLRNGDLTGITSTRNAAEAGPAWSPDGKQICYVSDSSGRPHLYIVNRNGSNRRRLTYHGRENVAPDWGPSGLIAYAGLRDGLYRIFVADPESGEEKQITTDAANYEDPSWAPDGRHMVCSRSEGHRSAVYVLDTFEDGLISLTPEKGSWHSPAWSRK